jgi:hypothetical protein
MDKGKGTRMFLPLEVQFDTRKLNEFDWFHSSAAVIIINTIVEAVESAGVRSLGVYSNPDSLLFAFMCKRETV